MHAAQTNTDASEIDRLHGRVNALPVAVGFCSFFLCKTDKCLAAANELLSEVICCGAPSHI